MTLDMHRYYTTGAFFYNVWKSYVTYYNGTKNYGMLKKSREVSINTETTLKLIFKK